MYFLKIYKNKNKEFLDAWWMSHLSQQPREPAYYIVDCRISRSELREQAGEKRVELCYSHR